MSHLFDRDLYSIFSSPLGNPGLYRFLIRITGLFPPALFVLREDSEPTLLGGSMTDERGETTEVASHEFAGTAVPIVIQAMEASYRTAKTFEA
jgi:hypothetical protein